MVRFGFAEMADEALLEAFEAGTLPAANFAHGDHLRVTWLLLERLPREDALVELRGGLKALAASAGKPERYHETVTRGWLTLVAAGLTAYGNFEAYAESLHAGNALLEYWSAAVLESPAARTGWVEPDVAQLP